MTNPTQTLQQAIDLREQNKTLEAINAFNQILINTPDIDTQISAYVHLGIAYKHLFLESKDTSFAKIFLSLAQIAVDITKDNKPKLDRVSVYTNLGDALTTNKKYKDAIKYYKKALVHFKSSLAEKGRLRYHLGVAQFLNDKKNLGKANLLKGLKEIEKGYSDVDKFLADVWLSGCLLKLYKLLGEKQYLDQAKKVIESNSKLVIRKKQLEAVI